MVLDKTGIITEGRPVVTDIVMAHAVPEPAAVGGNGAGEDSGPGAPGDMNADALLRLAASAERGSEHPLGAAMVRAAQERGLALSQPECFEAVAGHGISAVVDSRLVLLGNLRLMREWSVATASIESDIERLQGEDKAALIVAADGAVLGVIAVADTVKPTSQAAVARSTVLVFRWRC